jgi:predicted GNAT superfamily acetyltransferase
MSVLKKDYAAGPTVDSRLYARYLKRRLRTGPLGKMLTFKSEPQDPDSYAESNICVQRKSNNNFLYVIRLCLFDSFMATSGKRYLQVDLYDETLEEEFHDDCCILTCDFPGRFSLKAGKRLFDRLYKIMLLGTL